MRLLKNNRMFTALLIAALLIVPFVLSACDPASGPFGPVDGVSTPAASNAEPAVSGAEPAVSGAESAVSDPEQPSGQTSVPSGTDPVSQEQGNLPGASYTVKPAAWASVEWEQYSNVYFTLTIPKGWKVQWKGNAQQLYWVLIIVNKRLCLLMIYIKSLLYCLRFIIIS